MGDSISSGERRSNRSKVKGDLLYCGFPMHLLTRVGCSEGIVSDVEPSAIEGDSLLLSLREHGSPLVLESRRLGVLRKAGGKFLPNLNMTRQKTDRTRHEDHSGI